MPITARVGGLWADALDPIVRFNTDVGYGRRANTLLMSQLFAVKNSVRAYEAVSGVGVIGPDAWANYEESGAVSEADFDQGYKKTYTHREYPLDLSIKRKLIDDGNFAEVMRVAQRMGDSAAVKRETDAASVFNNAFSSSFTGGDAVALCSASHPLSPQNPGTQSNTFTYSLTKDNVSTMRIAMMKFTDDKGTIAGVVPNLLLVPIDLEDQAKIICNSPLDPTSANNAVNPQGTGRWTYKVWPYLTDTNAWFMIDSVLMGMFLEWWDRVPLSVNRRAGDDETLEAYWRAYMRYSFGFSDWVWVAGSNPS